MMMILYSTTSAFSRASKSKSPREAARASVLGMIEIGPPSGRGSCAGAYVVRFSAGPGYAKQLYGSAYALSPSGLLAPDRHSVSPEAYASWSKVASSRRKRVKLDSDVDPTTPDSADDCEIHGPQDNDCAWDHRDPAPLNAAYAAEGWEKSMLAGLKKNHDAFLRALSSQGSYKGFGESFKDALESAASDFFNDAYTGASGA
jgi:hypothetical protein